MVNFGAMQVIDGAMLSDAHIASNRGYPYFKIALAGSQHLDWLDCIEDALTLLEIESALCPVVERINDFTKRPYEYCELRSRGKCNPLVRTLRERWYPGGVKGVPRDLVLTPRAVAHWFMGDGSSTRLKRREFYVRAAFCTQGFVDNDVVLLADKLSSLGLTVNIGLVSRGKGLVLFVTSVGEVNRLMDLVEPYVLPSYEYKIKKAFFSMGEFREKVPAW